MNNISMRFDKKLWPSNASRSAIGMPERMPLTIPAATTTSAGFKRRANPATTTATPNNGQ